MKSRFLVKIMHNGKEKLVEALTVDLWDAVVEILQTHPGAAFMALVSVTPEEIQGRA